MDYATLAQGSQLQNLVVRKKLTVERLQALFETGLLTDLMDSDPSEVNRNDLRVVLGLEPKDRHIVRLRKGETFQGVIERGRWDQIDPTITPERYPFSIEHNRQLTMEVVNFGVSLNRVQAIEKAAKQGLKPPTYMEALGFCADYCYMRPLLAIVFPHEPVDGKMLAYGTNMRNFRGLTEFEEGFIGGPDCPWAFVRPSILRKSRN